MNRRNQVTLPLQVDFKTWKDTMNYTEKHARIQKVLTGSNIDNVYFLLDEGKGGSKYNLKRAIIGSPTKRH